MFLEYITIITKNSVERNIDLIKQSLNMADPRINRPLPFVHPYIFSNNASEFVEFLKNVFSAKETRPTAYSDDGKIQNALLQIGQSLFEISSARGEFKPQTLSFHLYIENVEGIHAHALKFGCKEKNKPTKMDYGDLESWIIDPFENNWFLATYLERKPE